MAWRMVSAMPDGPSPGQLMRPSASVAANLGSAVAPDAHQLGAAHGGALPVGQRKQSFARQSPDDSSRAALRACCPEPARLLLV